MPIVPPAPLPVGVSFNRLTLASVLVLVLSNFVACNAGRAVGAEDIGTRTSITHGVASGTPSQPNDASGDPLPVSGTRQTLPGAGFAAAANGNAVVIYWGQNDNGTEPDLATVCHVPQYSTIILSFVYAFGGSNSHDPNGYPGINFSTHCTTSFSAANPNFLQCPELAAAIPVCQSNGKKILLSMGGAVGTYGFADDSDGQKTAQLIWDTFLGGEDTWRPFGGAIVDGVDLDIEQGTSTGYAAFVKALRALMRADTRKPYYITGAPQCVYPDPYLGPGGTTALGEAATDFDFLFVQFYNNVSCETSSPQGWTTALGAWTGLRGVDGPKIFMGLPATAAAARTGYLNPNDAAPVVHSLTASSAVGGMMLWDVAYDTTSPGPYSLTMQAALQASLP